MLEIEKNSRIVSLWESVTMHADSCGSSELDENIVIVEFDGVVTGSCGFVSMLEWSRVLS